MATHYTCGVTHFFFILLFQPEPLSILLRISVLQASLVPLSFLEKANGHSFPFQYRHLVYFRIVFQIIGKSQQQYLTLVL